MEQNNKAERLVTMKRVLCILNNMNSGGAETFLMKIYRTIDKTKYQMDFCINVKEKCFYDDEIRSLGGKIFYVPPKSKSLSEFKTKLFELISNEKYEYVLRISTNSFSFLDVKIAKGAGAKYCAVRAANSGNSSGIKGYVMHHIGRRMYQKYIDTMISPSDLAAEYTFGKRAYKAGRVNILHNAVDINVFKYDAEERSRIRNEFGISDNTLLLGHVGRFMEQKNHGFLLDVFSRVLKKNSNSVLLLVGNGELQDKVKAKAEALGISDSIIFAGVRSDVPSVLSAMDVFVFPSLFEGMPNTVIEAQATGLSCVISDKITKEADITGLVKYLPIDNPSVWADYICSLDTSGRKDTKQDFIDNKYDIESSAEEFVRLVFGD